MILRRPYAFLAKHFRAIHAILLMGAFFLMFKIYNLVSFFGSYIKNNGAPSDVAEASSKYVPISAILVTILMALVVGIIIYLLKHKKKKIKAYIFILVFYIILALMLFWMSSFLSGLQWSSPGIRFISIIRDAFRSCLVINVGVMALCFIRAIGFDLSKFDFKKDLLDLGVEEADNEEYEFDFKIDKDALKAKARKRLRYFKYFYRENKFVFITLEVIVALVIAASIIRIFTGIEKVYKQNQYFETSALKMKVLDSYKTKTNTFGTKLNTKFFYVITKIEFQNKMGYDYTIGSDELKLSYSDYEITAPTTSENAKLSEFGVNYFSQIIKPYETRTFNFIFEIPVEYYYEDFTLKFLYNIEYVDNEMKYSYKKVDLNLKEFSDTATVVKTAKLGEEMSFEGSILGNTKITINNMNINDTFFYNTNKCSTITSSCTTVTRSKTARTTETFDLTLLRLNYKIDYDYDTLGAKYSNDLFISRFATIRFEVNGKEYNNRLDLVDVTPYYTKDYAIVEVRDKLKLADKIYLDFRIRDKVYTYIIKDNTPTEEPKGEE